MNELSIITTLLLIMDPVGNIPNFSVLLMKINPKRRFIVLLREMLFAYLLILFFFFAGKKVLDVLGLKKESLMIAGGIILFMIAIDMVFKGVASMIDEDYDEEPFLIPIATPFIAGPSLFASIVIFTTTFEIFYWKLLLLITIAWLINSVVLMFAPVICHVLRQKAMTAIKKLMGMVLVALSVQMLLNGVIEFIQTTAN